MRGFTEDIINTITSRVFVDQKEIDIPQGDEGAFRRLGYYSDPDEIIPMEIYGNEEELTFQILCPEHAKEYSKRIAPFLWGMVSGLVENVMIYKFGLPVFDEKRELTFVIGED